MPPAADRSAVSSPLSGRRLISKITSPFTHKPRNVAQFDVAVNDSYRQYSPGDIVTGSVRLRVLKPTRVTHITVCLHGYVQVFKNPGATGEGYKANSSHIGNRHGKKGGEYFGNGFASLFEDEVVLCGDGRLAEGSYQFNFELEFPNKDLPSSIDFERGTIAYMITATMTRPTMSPTMTTATKIYFVERIDISNLCPPKARTIILEPLSKRTRAKTQARKLVDAAERQTRKTDSPQRCSQHRNSEASSAPSGSLNVRETPSSPAPSEISFDSLISSAERTSQAADASRQSHSTSDNGTYTSRASAQGRTITATVESLCGGCLRGDSIGVRVCIQHTKLVKSLYGVIVTLYRQARVDMHPAIPLGPTEKGSKAKYEDHFPKSVTGLGGLSLSGAGPSHVFRKDLMQTTVPLFIDPSSLTAEINAKIRVPEEAFPTISTVPGGMISFKYYVEVVLDIQGKLASQDRNLGNFGGLTSGQSMMGAMGSFDTYENERSATAQFGASIVDTTQIRRDKGLVTCTFEVIVGTRDSERRKGKRKLESLPVPHEGERQAQPGGPTNISPAANEVHWDDEPQVPSGTQWNQQPPPGDPYWNSQGVFDYVTGHRDYHHVELLPAIPLSHLPDESALSEKEQLQRAAARLLPSQPPGTETENGDLNGDEVEATAPHLPHEDGVDFGPETGQSAPAYGASPSSPPINMPARHQFQSSAPGYDTPQATSATAAAPASDDKIELQRRNLEQEASAPPRDGNDGPGPSTPTTAAAAAVLGSSAPTADEAAAEFDSHADATGFSTLPKYER